MDCFHSYTLSCPHGICLQVSMTLWEKLPPFLFNWTSQGTVNGWLGGSLASGPFLTSGVQPGQEPSALTFKVIQGTGGEPRLPVLRCPLSLGQYPRGATGRRAALRFQKLGSSTVQNEPHALPRQHILVCFLPLVPEPLGRFLIGVKSDPYWRAFNFYK